MTEQTTKISSQPIKQPGFLQSVLSVGSANLITIIFLFLEIMVAVRLLDTASYGIFVLLIAITNFFVMFIDCGSKTAMPQLIASSEPDKQAKLVSSIILLRFIIIAAAFIIILPGKSLLSLFISSPEIRQYAVFVLMMIMSASFDELLNSILQGFHAYNHIAISTCLRSAMRLVLTIFFLMVMKLDMMGLVYSWIISACLSALYQLIFTSVPIRFEINRHTLKEILKFGFPLQLSRFIWFVSGRVNIFLLGILALPSSVALFDAGEKIPKALHSLSASFITVFYPSMTRLLAEGKIEKAEKMLDQAMRIISVAAAFLALIAVLFSKEIVTLLFSAKYSNSNHVFAILMIAFHLEFLVQLMGYTLTSAGYPGRSLVENTVRVIVIILGNIILIPRIGIAGAAFATLIANYIAVPLSIWLLGRSKIPVNVTMFIKTVFIFLVFAGLFWWFQPTYLIIKFAILLLYIIINLSFSTITRADLAAMLPDAMTRRIVILQKV